MYFPNPAVLICIFSFFLVFLNIGRRRFCSLRGLLNTTLSVLHRYIHGEPEWQDRFVWIYWEVLGAKALNSLSIGTNSSDPNDKVRLNWAGGSEVPTLGMALSFPDSPAELQEENWASSGWSPNTNISCASKVCPWNVAHHESKSPHAYCLFGQALNAQVRKQRGFAHSKTDRRWNTPIQVRPNQFHQQLVEQQV